MSFEVPVPQYCDPDIVAEFLNLPKPRGEPGEIFRFTNISNPSYNHVCRLIAAQEGLIDRTARRTWRINYVYNRVFSIPKYWQDENSVYRDQYLKADGSVIQLHKNVCEWDPDPVYAPNHDGDPNYILYPGDKIEVRVLGAWKNISENNDDASYVPDTFDFDYQSGRMKLRVPYLGLRPKFDAIRITYRYGPEFPDEYIGGGIPPEVQIACAAMVAKILIRSQFAAIKAGIQGASLDVNAFIQMCDEQINLFQTAYRRIGGVYPMVRR